MLIVPAQTAANKLELKRHVELIKDAVARTWRLDCAKR